MQPPGLRGQKHCYQEHLPHERVSYQDLTEEKLCATKSRELPVGIPGGPIAGGCEEGSSRQMSSFWAMPADSIGTVFQIGEKSA